MVYAYDLWAQLPVRDLYDTLMMLASINAAKDMYEKGAKEMKEFRDKYDDFYTSIPEHQERYNNIIKDVYDTINRYYDMGIDPLRTVEGRMALTRKINSLPYDEIGKIKASAKRKEEYDKNAAALQKAGLWDPEFAQWQLRGWKPVNDDGTVNTFTEQSPMPYQGIFGLTSPLVKDIKPHTMSKDLVVSSGYEYDPRLQYTGVALEDIDKALSDGIPGLRGNPEYDFHRERIRGELIKGGNPNPTDQDIDNEFQRQAAISHYATRTPFKIDIDPIHALSVSRSRGGGSRGLGYENDDYYFDWSDDLWERTVADLYGTNVDSFDPVGMGNNFDNMYYGRLSKFGKDGKIDTEGWKNFVNSIKIEGSISNDLLAKYLERKQNDDGTIRTTKQDVFYSTGGLRSKESRGIINNKTYTNAMTTGSTVGIKDPLTNKYEIFAECDLYDDDDHKIYTGWVKLPHLEKTFVNGQEGNKTMVPDERQGSARYGRSNRPNSAYGNIKNVPWLNNTKL